MTTDAWNQPGTIQIEDSGTVHVLRIRGNLHRDLPPRERDALCEQLRLRGVRSALLVDLSEVLRLDSWGEDKLADLVTDVVRGGGAVAVQSDPARPHHLRSLAVLLRRHGERVRTGDEEPPLREWLTKEARL